MSPHQHEQRDTKPAAGDDECVGCSAEEAVRHVGLLLKLTVLDLQVLDLLSVCRGLRPLLRCAASNHVCSQQSQAHLLSDHATFLSSLAWGISITVLARWPYVSCTARAMS
jgi:hypothetical protein